MARNRASMREGPLAELFRATEARAAPAARAAGTADRAFAVRPTPAPDPPATDADPCRRSGTRSRALPPRRAAAAARPLARPAARPAGAARAWAGQRVVPRGHPRRRCRRRRPERARSHDRRRHHAGRFRRGQHRHPAAADKRRADEDPHRQRAHRGARLGLGSGGRPSRRRGRLRRDQARAARLRHGLRHCG